MFAYSLEDKKEQSVFLDSIKEDYLYNFSWALNRPIIGPHMLQLLLTTKCNLQCKMCGVWRTNEEELDTHYAKKTIDDAYKMGNLREVYFTGGEALLRADIFNLIKYVKDFYPDIWITINTNGTLLTKKIIDKLIDVRLCALGISVDSPLSEIHNALRGEKVLERVIEAIDYLNNEKKRRGAQYPLLDTCSVLMDQTLDTMPAMVDFCIKYNFSGFHIQPYVCNSDLRGQREDKFWIKNERLPLLRDTLEKIERRKKDIPRLHIEVPVEKIYKYFSEPIYVDKCYAGFTRALVVGKKINFVCNGPNNEKYQHFGMADKDSIDEVLYSENADLFRRTIRACKRNCVQFCSIRPSSDSTADIHRRLVAQNNLFLVFRELHFLEENMLKYPSLPLKELIDSDYELITRNLDSFLRIIDTLEPNACSAGLKRCLAEDIKLVDIYLKKIGDERRALSSLKGVLPV